MGNRRDWLRCTRHGVLQLRDVLIRAKEHTIMSDVPSDRRVRLPLRLREQLPDRTRRVGRMALPAPSRLAERLRGPARPLGRFVPLRTLEHHGPPPPPLHPRHHGGRDHLAHPDGLARRPGPHGHPQGGRRRRGGPATGGHPPIRRPPECCCARPPASPARSRSSPTAYRCSTTASATGQWAYDGDGYGSLTVARAGRRIDALGGEQPPARAWSAPAATGAPAWPRARSASSPCRGGKVTPRPTRTRRTGTSTPRWPTGVTGWPPGRSPTTRGAPTSSAVR